MREAQSYLGHGAPWSPLAGHESSDIQSSTEHIRKMGLKRSPVCFVGGPLFPHTTTVYGGHPKSSV